MAVLALSAACSSSSGKSSAPAPTAAGGGSSLRIASFSFSKLSVAAGATVTVTNSDSADHTVTSDTKGLFDVTAEKGTPVTFTAPTKPGSYAFSCSIHSSMHGTLTVTP